MSVHDFYAALDVDLPDRGGSEAPVRCFANPDAHKHDDRNASASINVHTGVFFCHACGVGGGAYDAAVALGRTPADAMRLLKDHGLTDPEPVPAAPRREDVDVSESDVRRHRATLVASRGGLRRLEQLRGWSPETVERLELGLDGDRIVFPVRDAHGSPVGLLRYAPDADRRDGAPKMLAAKGTRRDLFPAPETIGGDTIWLVEGEPDAVSGHELGLPAVGIPGTGKAAQWGERFAGRHVIVAFDCDRPGREAARKAADSLVPHAASVRVLDLEASRDDGYDIGDLLCEANANGGTAHVTKLLAQMVEWAAPVNGTAPEATAATTTPTPAATGDLLRAAEEFIARYVVAPGVHEATTLALFILHSHAIEAAHATPYLIVLSPERRTGKTLLLEVVELLVARPWRIVAVSEAAMFRKIAQDKPTLLLDEIDAIFGSQSERTEPLRALLNAGNRPGASVSRCVGQGEITVADFEVFCPKVLAGIDTGRLPDTIRDRGVEIRMKRKTAAEKVERFRVRHATPAAEGLREQFTGWSDAAGDKLREAEPDLPDALNDRAAEAWEPLFAIADLAGGDWPHRARAAALALAEGADMEEASHGTRILAALARLLSDKPAVSTEQALGAINGDDELPFGGWRDGRGLDARGLARLLRPYGPRPRSVRLADGSTPKGYHRDEIAEEAFARYLPRPTPPEAPQAPQAPHGANEAAGIPLPNADVADVADVADKTDMGAEAA